jgi:hypothetical protein
VRVKVLSACRESRPAMMCVVLVGPLASCHGSAVPFVGRQLIVADDSSGHGRDGVKAARDDQESQEKTLH